MQRPEIICHMITTIDGRLLADRWPVTEETLLDVYDAAAARLQGDGWIVGRATMEAHYIAARPDCGDADGPRADCVDQVAPGHDALSGIGICLDRQARLMPESGDIDGAHLVMVVGGGVSQARVDALVAAGVSVFFQEAGAGALADVLARIGQAFGARRLILEGGGVLNGAFLAEGLIDETSTLVFPVVDGQSGLPAIYDHPGQTVPRKLELIAVETVDKGCVWIRHRLTRTAG